MTMPRSLVLLALVAALAMGTRAQTVPGATALPEPGEVLAGGCVAGWINTFDPAVGVNGQLQDMLEHDDGSGNALYVAGFFTAAGSVPAQSIARWDGSEWSALGAGLDGIVNALAVYDDGLGGGPQLYAAGGFTMSGGVSMPRIARWDGATWNPVSIGMNGPLHALAVHGGALYAGGSFSFAGGVPAANVARWDGVTWSALGSGTPAIVLALGSYDDGGGADLYVGGLWPAEPGFPYDNIARWGGASWSGLDGGMSNVVWSLQVFDWGLGPRLMVGGNGGTAGTGALPHNGIAAWDGSAWSTPLSPSTGGVQDMALGTLGVDPVLLMAGTVLDGVAAWDGATLTALGDLAPFVDCVTSFDLGGGPQIACGGPFDSDYSAYGLEHVAIWGGSDWEAVGGPGLSGSVHAALGHDDGSGPALWVGGSFGFPGGGSHGFARWKDGAWDSLGGSVGQPILDMVRFDDGAGINLYACGRIKPGGGTSFFDIARWDGASWTEIGDTSGASTVNDLFVYDDGGGQDLYAAGSFSGVNGVTAANIARWDGSSWSAVGSGPGGTVLAMEAYDDGSGTQLYVGGTFNTFIGSSGDYVARWDGATWSDLGGGPSFASSGVAVRALEVWEYFGEEHLYVGGSFADVNGIPFTEGLARFDGSGWSTLPFAGFTGDVHALQVDYDGVFSRLVVGGEFEGLGLFTLGNLAAWNGFGWENYSGGVDGTVLALAIADVDDGLGPLLVAGGDFTHQVNQSVDDGHLARWGGCWTGVENWTDLGFALGGTSGDPLLEGFGSLAPYSWNEVNLSNAFPSAFSGLFLSFASTPIPFMGGTLVPNPWIDPPIFATTSASGEIPLGFLMPEDLPPGTELFVQWAIQDPGGPSGVALSNALRGDVP
jgi:hypothetical protein